MRVLGWLTAIAFILAACGGGAASPSPVPTGAPTPRPPNAPQETPPPVSIVPQELLDEVLDQAARQAGVGLDELAIERAEAVTWSDGSLGCPAPGEMYTQALVDGWWVVVRAAGQTYDFHLSQSGTIKLCPPGRGRPPVGSEPTDDAPGTLAPGPTAFRVVNLYRDDTGAAVPLDIYARTQDLVEAFPVVMGLQPGEATDYFALPDPGKVVITDEGAGDPTCVASCDHFITESSTNFGQGDARTMIVYDEGTLELWHNPDAGSVGNSGNALAPADPSIALLFVVGVALQDADFGLRLGYATEEGCEVNRTAENILVGGNQVAVFAFDSSAGVVLYDNGDLDCSGEPVGGPFPVSGAAGSRTLLVLFGSPGAMEALTLEI